MVHISSFGQRLYLAHITSFASFGGEAAERAKKNNVGGLAALQTSHLVDDHVQQK
jgi:hypothetical protein